MKRTKIEVLRTKSVEELMSDIAKFRAELVASRRAMMLGEMKNVSKINHLRKEIARHLTVIAEKQVGEEK